MTTANPCLLKVLKAGIFAARPQLSFRWVARYGTANSRVLEPAAAVRNPYPAGVHLPRAAHDTDQ